MDFFEYLSKEKDLKLNEEQTEAVEFNFGNALVLSTAGSGKTTVIICRAARMIYENVCENKILTITFSKFSADDMKKRFNKHFSESIYRNRIDFSTIHAFMYRIVTDYFNKKKLPMKLMSSNYKAVEEVLKHVYQNNYYNKVNEDEIENIISNISYVKNMMLSMSSDYVKNNDVKEFATIFEEYDKYKRSNNVYDFDDMLVYGYNILKKYKSYSEELKKKYDYVQVDEMQDTSKLQIAIIMQITDNNLFMVGDDDQSIYSFRGSYPEYMLNFSNVCQDGKIFYLGKNYRSDAYIVNTAKNLIAINHSRYEKSIIPSREFNTKVNILKVKNRVVQNKYILKHINEFEGKSIGILYRYNIGSVIIANSLHENGVEFKIKDDKSKFFNNFVLKDVLSFINLAKNNTDKVAFSKIYYKSFTYFTRDMCDFVKKSESGKSVFEILKSYPSLTTKQYERLLSFETSINMINKINVSSLISHIKYNVQYYDYLEHLEESGRNRLSFTTQILEILENIAKYSGNLDDFLMKINGLKAVLAQAKLKDSEIMLTSIHGAKGLEFDIVFFIDNISGEFPRARINESLGVYEKYIEEERRLFYVALTRAKDRLFVFTEDEPSKFVFEMINNNNKSKPKKNNH